MKRLLMCVLLAGTIFIGANDPPESARLPSQGGPCNVDFPKVVCAPGNVGAGDSTTIKSIARGAQSDSLHDRVHATTSTVELESDDNRAISSGKVS